MHRTRDSSSGAPTRRSWLKALAGAALLGSVGTLLAQLGLFALDRREATPRRLFIGRLGDLPTGHPRFVRGVGYAGAWLQRDATGRVLAFSAACPHLGCPLEWDEDGATFNCGCHGGRFALEGRPLSGPPERAGVGLTSLPAAVDPAGGAVYLVLEEVEGT
ncbi:MAG: Rieske (2Fe-2S) protein [Candidatus Latescibacterota bacterium]